MSTVEERFETCVKQVDSVVAVLTALKEMGIYGRPEASAGVTLLDTLERAMRVLDPERTIEYAKEQMERQSESPVYDILSELQDTMANGSPDNTGLYL